MTKIKLSDKKNTRRKKIYRKRKIKAPNTPKEKYDKRFTGLDSGKNISLDDTCSPHIRQNVCSSFMAFPQH
jgi:hypothetical protein